MKKLLLSLSIVLAFGSTQGQNLLTENFNVFPLTWTQTNQSTTVGTNPLWGLGNTVVFTGYNEAGTANYAASNYNATTGAGTISNWLITPSLNLENGDVITFYTRTVTEVLFADRMEMRISTAGEFTALPAGGPTGLGDFTTLAVEINPAMNLVDYPNVWTQFTYTMAGLTGPTDCKIAFRYYVPSGGPAGDNSSYIGVDNVSVDRPVAATESFFKSNFAVYPNPASNVLNISNKNGMALTTAKITDINGRVVSETNINSVSDAQINIASLNAGVYFLNLASDKGIGVTKIVKN